MELHTFQSFLVMRKSGIHICTSFTTVKSPMEEYYSSTVRTQAHYSSTSSTWSYKIMLVVIVTGLDVNCGDQRGHDCGNEGQSTAPDTTTPRTYLLSH